jgi:hypothetical protein
MLAEGLSNKEIAWRMKLSEHTVKFHVASVFAKLDVSTRTEAVTQGIRRGLSDVVGDEGRRDARGRARGEGTTTGSPARITSQHREQDGSCSPVAGTASPALSLCGVLPFTLPLFPLTSAGHVPVACFIPLRSRGS